MTIKFDIEITIFFVVVVSLGLPNILINPFTPGNL